MTIISRLRSFTLKEIDFGWERHRFYNVDALASTNNSKCQVLGAEKQRVECMFIGKISAMA